jgi:hypothetical protein
MEPGRLSLGGRFGIRTNELPLVEEYLLPIRCDDEPVVFSGTEPFEVPRTLWHGAVVDEAGRTLGWLDYLDPLASEHIKVGVCQ